MSSEPSDDVLALRQLAGSVRKGEAMFRAPDMRATVQWYVGLGFTVADEFEDAGELTFARLSFGECAFALSPGATTGPRDTSLWLFTERVVELYQRMKRLTSSFDEELYAPFYGGQQFSVRDPNGLVLVFWQPDGLTAQPGASA